jgi:hypothetical protein
VTTQVETQLLNRLKDAMTAGEPADFRRSPWKQLSNDRTLSAKTVRALVLGDNAPSGVQILGAIIEGDLDLRNGRGSSGGACNTLKLENCDLVGSDPAKRPALDACHSHLSRLSLINCRTTGIHLSSAVIDGDLILEGLKPLPPRVLGVGRPGAGECSIRARGIRVDGSVVVSRVHLQLGRPLDFRRHPLPEGEREDTPRALNLQLAHIGGGLDLRFAKITKGQVNIQAARIGGYLRAEGAHLAASGGGGQRNLALSASYAQIGGSVFLIENFQASGQIDFTAAKISGLLRFEGHSVSGGLFSSLEPEAGQTGESVDGTDTLGLTDAVIEGSVDLQGVRQLLAFDASFGSSLTMTKFDGWTVLDGAVIRTNLTIKGEDVSSEDLRSVAADASRPIRHLSAQGVKVGGSFSVSGSVIGQVDLSRANIDGELLLGPLMLASVDGSTPGLNLADAEVAGDFSVFRLETGALVSRRLADTPPRIRTAKLSFYKGWQLAEALFRAEPASDLVILGFLYRDPKPGGEPAIVVLDGTSSPIFERNDDLDDQGNRVLDISTVQQATEYLTFFCANVWADDGAFVITPDTIKMERGNAPKYPWMASAEVTYGDTLFKAEFRIDSATGEITMTDDSPIHELTKHQPVRYDKPYRRILALPAQTNGDWPTQPVAGKDSGWTEAHDARLQKILKNPALLPKLGDQTTSQNTPPVIDLSGLKVGSLKDSNGSSWLGGEGHESATASVRLVLKDLTYDRIDTKQASEQFSDASAGDGGGARQYQQSRSRATKPKPLEHRRSWLRTQYKNPEAVTEDEYEPQPYEQLAKVWRAEGRYSEATSITFDRLDLERKVRNGPVFEGGIGRFSERTVRMIQGAVFVVFLALLAGVIRGYIPGENWGSPIVAGFVGSLLLLLPTGFLKFWLFQAPFGYGLKTGYALLTFVSLWVLGAALVFLGTNEISGHIIKVDASSVGTQASETTPGDPTTVTPVVIPVVGVPGSPTEIPCRNQVDPLLYALDVMVPLLDFRQEQRCTVSSAPNAWLWRFVKVGYAVVGWIVVSGLVLTASGFVRRQIER